MADKFNWDAYEDAPEVKTEAPTFDWDAYDDEISKTESALRGGAQGATAGFIDEIVGGAQGMWDDAKALFTGKNANNGVKPEFDQFGNVTNGDKLTGDYEKYRDEYRAADKKAQEANPFTYKASDIGASVLTGALLPGANSLKGAMAFGAAQGVGTSEAEGVDLGIDAAKGATAGAIGYGIGKGVEKGWKAGKVLSNNEARSAVKEATGDAMRAETLLNELPTGKYISGALAASKKIDEITGSTVATRELSQSMRKHLGPGSVKDLTDDEVLAIALTDEGTNPVKDFVSKKAATLGVDAKEYLSFLSKNVDESYSNRMFDKREAADELAPLLDDLRNTFEGARTSRMQELTTKARAEFKGDVRPSLEAIKKAHAGAGELKTTKPAQGALEDAWEILANGKGGEELGVTAGSWTSFEGPELFNRLQKAREHLDDNIDWVAIRKGVRSPTPVEKKLIKVREQMDAALKGASEAKVEADGLFKKSKELENTFFKLAEDKDGMNEISLAKLLGDNDRARKFKSWLGDMEEFANRPDLSPELKKSAGAFLDRVKAGMTAAEEQRKLSSFKMRTGGPTSGAVDRLGTVAKGNDYLKRFVTTPQQALMNREQLGQRSLELYGKSWDALASNEKRNLISYQMWASKNLDANPERAAEVWREIVRKRK